MARKIIAKRGLQFRVGKAGTNTRVNSTLYKVVADILAIPQEEARLYTDAVTASIVLQLVEKSAVDLNRFIRLRVSAMGKDSKLVVKTVNKYVIDKLFEADNFESVGIDYILDVHKERLRAIKERHAKIQEDNRRELQDDT